MHETNTTGPKPSGVWFTTTHWSIVVSARGIDSPARVVALEALCRTYWYPLYAYLRRQGHNPPDAQDLTQGFFERLLEKDYLRSVASSKGKFRTFLLVALKRFAADDWDRRRARKRGGGQPELSLDTTAAESAYQQESAPNLSAERLYERRWALTLLDQTMARLKKEFGAEGKAREFDLLKGVLTVERGGIEYAALAGELGLSDGAVRAAVHRLRRKFRTVFREEIANTLSDPDELQDEIRYLMTLFSE